MLRSINFAMIMSLITISCKQRPENTSETMWFLEVMDGTFGPIIIPGSSIIDDFENENLALAEPNNNVTKSINGKAGRLLQLVAGRSSYVLVHTKLEKKTQLFINKLAESNYRSLNKTLLKTEKFLGASGAIDPQKLAVNKDFRADCSNKSATFGRDVTLTPSAIDSTLPMVCFEIVAFAQTATSYSEFKRTISSHQSAKQLFGKHVSPEFTTYFANLRFNLGLEVFQSEILSAI